MCNMLTVNEIKKLILTGRTDLFYKDYTWRKLSQEVIAENNNECYQCKLMGKYTRAKLVHHVKHLKEYPELAYDRVYTDCEGVHMQLMPLCFNCHERIHERGLYVPTRTKGFTNEEKW